MNATNQEAQPIARALTPSTAVQRAHSNAQMQTSTQALITAIAAEHDTVEADTQRLEVLRKYKQRLGMMRQRNKADPMLSGLIDSQEDKVHDAQTELIQSTSRLTHTSLQLLLANTATAEVQGARQETLQEHQTSLQQQADKLKDQARQLLAWQKSLQQEHASIQAAHQGLMQAHGITKAQARQLVGCVEQVTRAEQRFAAANLQLRTALEQSLEATAKDCTEQVNTGFARMELRQGSFEKQITSELSAQSKRTRERLALFTKTSADFEIALSQQLQSHTQAVVDHVAAQHVLLSQQQEASAAQLQTFQHDIRQELGTTLEHNTRALRTTMDGVEQAVQTAAQAQRTALDSSVQRLDTDLGRIAHALTTTDTHLGHTTEALSALAQQINQLQAQQHADRRRYLRTVAVVASIAIASLAWQLATRYALI